VKYKTYAIVLSVVLLSLCMTVDNQNAKVPLKKPAAAPVKTPSPAPQKNSPYTPCQGCNVILITIDALAAGHVGAYGYPRNTTPNIDRISRNGVLFKNAYTQWPMTSQSLASMMSGRYPYEIGVMKLRTKVPDKTLMLAEILKSEGYYTSGFVGNVNLAKSFEFDQGFDEYHEMWSEFDPKLTKFPISSWYPAGKINEEVMPWLKGRTGKRFFLWIHYIDPHQPYWPPAPFNNSFVGDKLYGDGKIIPWSKVLKFYPYLPRGKPVDVSYLISQYDGEVAYADSNVGEFLLEIEAQGLLKNSVVIITADHGEGMDEHDPYFGHGIGLYNSQLKVPLIIYSPGVEPRVVETPVGLVDVVPTVLGILGKNIASKRLSGRSLIPAMVGQDFSEDVFSESHGLYSVVEGDFKLIASKKNKAKTLFNLQSDPAELNPVVDNALTERLSKKIEAYSKKEKTSKISSQPVKEMDETIKGQLEALGYMN